MGNNNIRENFFFSANSEHYQDAFLKWIFFNFKSDEEGETGEIVHFSRYFVKTLLNYNGAGIKSNPIQEIVVENQVDRSDVDFIIKTKNDKEHLILIEDKTKSSVHASNNRKKENTIYETQLEKYYESFLSNKKYENIFNEGKVHLFYYKNDYLGENEKGNIEDANKACERIFKEHIEKYGTQIKESVYKWNVLDIKAIQDIFTGYEATIKGTIKNPILKQYKECLDYKKKWLDVKTYPIYEEGYNELTDYYKKMVWFSYLKNHVYKKLKKYVTNKGGTINEPYWYQGRDDIHVALYAKEGDLAQVRVEMSSIMNPEAVVVKVTVYGAEKKVKGKTDNSYYKNNRDQIEGIANELDILYQKNNEKYLLKRDDSKPRRGEKKTYAVTDKICIRGNEDKNLIDIIKKCFDQLQKIDEDKRRKCEE